MPALILLAACASPSLQASDPDLRRRAVVLLGREELRAAVPELVELARTDPSPAVRSEILREVGLTRDPAVIPLLEESASSHPAEVLESWIAWGGPEGCARAAAVPIPRDSRMYRWYLASPCWAEAGR